MVVLDHFSVKSKSWHANDSNIFEGSKINFLTPSFGFHQIINKPTHVLNNSFSCIDLIFTTQLNLVMESGIHSSDQCSLTENSNVLPTDYELFTKASPVRTMILERR